MSCRNKLGLSDKPCFDVFACVSISKWKKKISGDANPFFAESEDFMRAKNAYSRKAELLQHLVEQQRARLEQISADLQRTSREASLGT